MYLLQIVATSLVLVTGSFAKPDYYKTDKESIAKGRAEAKTLSPTSNVKGKHFDRFVNIWFENTDFESAAADAGFQFVMEHGITLTNYLAVAHPSQPNYVAAVSGSQHGVSSGRKYKIDTHAPTIVDLLDKKNISWGEYQEDMPYSGFQGDYKNPVNGRNDYVRKHNPLISFKNVYNNEDRLAQIKNFTMFYKDLENDKLPQWMFITPNMTSDGHDSSVRIAGKWAKGFIEPLLEDPKFMKRTLVLLTFDETEGYFPSNRNRVFSVLFGDAVPTALRGTKDSTKYSHYSNLVTVEKNWDLGVLPGKKRGDTRSNAFYPFNGDEGYFVEENLSTAPKIDD